MKALPAGRPYPRSGCFALGTPVASAGPVAVVSAGTGDEPVAEEAYVTLAMRGVAVKRFPDCGVAGLQRILARLDEIRGCVAVIAIAGMEGALPSVLGGLIDIPLIASSGAGSLDDCKAALDAGASAITISSMFIFTDHSPIKVRTYLATNGVNVRNQKGSRS